MCPNSLQLPTSNLSAPVTVRGTSKWARLKSCCWLQVWIHLVLLRKEAMTLKVWGLGWRMWALEQDRLCWRTHVPVVLTEPLSCSICGLGPLSQCWESNKGPCTLGQCHATELWFLPFANFLHTNSLTQQVPQSWVVVTLSTASDLYRTCPVESQSQPDGLVAQSLYKWRELHIKGFRDSQEWSRPL